MTVYTFDARSPEAAARIAPVFWAVSLAGSLSASVLAPLCAWLVLHSTYLLMYPVFLTGIAYAAGVVQGRISGQARRDWLWGSATAMAQLIAWAVTASVLADAGIAWMSFAGALPLVAAPVLAVLGVHLLLARPPIDLSFLRS